MGGAWIINYNILSDEICTLNMVATTTPPFSVPVPHNPQSLYKKKPSDCLLVYRVCYDHQCTAVAVVSLLIVMIIGNNHLLDYNQVWYPALGKLLFRFNKLEMMSIRAQQLSQIIHCLTDTDIALECWWKKSLYFVFYCIFVCFCVRKHTSKSWYTLVK